MSKVLIKNLTSLFPLPAVLATVTGKNGELGIVTIAWTGVLCSTPATVYIAVQPIRHSHQMLKDSMEYAINIPTKSMTKVVDFCGTRSGRDFDKFAETGLTPIPATFIKAPLIKECPVNIECRVKDVLHLGSHDVFVGEVAAVHCDEAFLTEAGTCDVSRLESIGYCAGSYFSVGEKLGVLGFTKK